MHFLVSNVLNVKSNFEHSENKQGVIYCQTPTEVFSQKLGVDFVFTPSQWQSQWQPHQKRVLPGNLGSWFSACKPFLTQVDEIWKKHL